MALTLGNGAADASLELIALTEQRTVQGRRLELTVLSPDHELLQDTEYTFTCGQYSATFTTDGRRSVDCTRSKGWGLHHAAAPLPAPQAAVVPMPGLPAP